MITLAIWTKQATIARIDYLSGSLVNVLGLNPDLLIKPRSKALPGNAPPGKLCFPQPRKGLLLFIEGFAKPVFCPISSRKFSGEFKILTYS